MDWVQRMNLVLDYIENNLDGEIEDNKIAKLSASSKGMFQRIFAALTDMTLSEYIRKRRLTQAAFDIRNTDEKIIDIAVKYGYNSADAFGLAFKNFHGAAPSDAKKSDVQTQSFYPLNFKFVLSVKGGNDMQYRIIEKGEFLLPTQEIAEVNAENTQLAAQLITEMSLSLEEITRKSNDLQKLIAEIREASREQANGIKQIRIKADSDE